MASKWTVHDINNRFLRGIVAWMILAPVLALLFVIVLFEAVYDGVSAFGERVADRFNEFNREVIKPHGWILLFRRDA